MSGSMNASERQKGETRREQDPPHDHDVSDEARGDGPRHAPEGEPDAGAYIGREPEFASETIPGGVQQRDERISAEDTQSSGVGAADERVQGRRDAWPAGHRRGDDVSDDDVRRSGDNPS
jgi:hypothetical protein